ncbi:MAG: sulfur carrier protein ThiS [Succinivibrio sp.]|nr:sulfur carrier protein ThiS [Succinivibrio sp.]
MEIYVNGKARQLERPLSLRDFLRAEQHPEEGCAVAVAEQIIPRTDWDKLELKEGMRIEIFTMVAGGSR